MTMFDTTGTIDPNATLEEIRRHVRWILNESVGEDVTTSDVMECADVLAPLVQSLDQALSNGAILPRDWNVDRGSAHTLFRVTFEVDNAAFEENGRDWEIANVLEGIARKLREGVSGGVARDSNGNTIGDYGVRLADGQSMP